MAAVEEKKDTEGLGAVQGDGASKIPNGVILDKDGKPCRACNSFSTFKHANDLMKGNTPKTTSTSSTTTASTSTTSRTAPPAECPPDVDALGRSTWTLLHSIAATYPETPSRSQQSDLVGFVSLFSKLYPCWVCAEDFRRYVARERVRAGSRGEFGMWLCGAHNEVNRKLGKREFDCTRWEERWVTGPKDGSCG